MKNIPCKKCPDCGLYNDFTIVSCECGFGLSGISPELVDIESLSATGFGEINEELHFFVQKCSACGTLNFTVDEHSPVKSCCNCHKTRIASIVPIEYVEDKESSSPDFPKEPFDDISVVEESQPKDRITTPFDDDDDDDDDNDSAQWSSILGNIKKAVGTPDAAVKIGTTTVMDEHTSSSENEEDDDSADWSGILGQEKRVKYEKKVENSKPDITLTAIRYGRLSFSVSAEDHGVYMLGRSANQKEFLVNDGRVGNEHCFLYFKDGCWHVKDNHSANGTAVNSMDIGLNGDHILNDGDELKLGHHSDSMAFRITIRL